VAILLSILLILRKSSTSTADIDKVSHDNNRVRGLVWEQEGTYILRTLFVSNHPWTPQNEARPTEGKECVWTTRRYHSAQPPYLVLVQLCY